MFKKIWNYLFGPKWYPNPAVVDFQVDQNGLQYGDKQPSVVIDYTLTKAQEPCKVDILPEEKPVVPNAFITDYSAGRMGNPYGPYAWLMQAPTEPEAAALYKTSAESKRIYFYNIGYMNHQKDHPMFGKVLFYSCKIGQPYQLSFSIPSVMAVTVPASLDKNETHTSLHDGKRIATDLINPNNLGTDQFSDEDSYTDILNSHGNDLSYRGIFWSFNNPPTEDELEKVKARLVEHYTHLIQDAGIKVYTSKTPYQAKVNFYLRKGFSEKEAKRVADDEVRITPEHHAAAEYLKVTSIWHPTLQTRKKSK